MPVSEGRFRSESSPRIRQLRAFSGFGNPTHPKAPEATPSARVAIPVPARFVQMDGIGLARIFPTLSFKLSDAWCVSPLSGIVPRRKRPDAGEIANELFGHRFSHHARRPKRPRLGPHPRVSRGRGHRSAWGPVDEPPKKPRACRTQGQGSYGASRQVPEQLGVRRAALPWHRRRPPRRLSVPGVPQQSGDAPGPSQWH